MATMIKCDRCGTEDETKGIGVVAGGPGIFAAVPAFRKTALPDDWRRVPMPQRDGSAWEKELCPPCVEALYAFMEGDGAVAGLLEPETLDAHGMTGQDPRPNLTARAEALTTAEAMEAIRTGEKAGRLLPCHEKAAQGRECSGWYEQGKGFLAHLEESHPGLNARGVAEARHDCPYCAGAYKGVLLGQHIAAEHPGEWEKWRSEGQPGW